MRAASVTECPCQPRRGVTLPAGPGTRPGSSGSACGLPAWIETRGLPG